jgi:hypothetical protein
VNPIDKMVKRYINMPLKKAMLFICVFVLASTTGCITSTTNTTSAESNKKDVSSGLEISSATLISTSTLSVRWTAPQSGNVFVVYNCTVKKLVRMASILERFIGISKGQAGTMTQ